MTIRGTLRVEEFEVELSGRIDGCHEGDPPILEEIKSTRIPLEQVEPRPAHRAQVEVYAALLARERSLPEVGLQLTYAELPDCLERGFEWRRSAAELEAMLDELLGRLVPILRRRERWAAVRTAAAAQAEFPHPEWRRGQARMMRGVFGRERAFVEAPTGIGKTLSALYPAVKMLGRRTVNRVFYLTAKNSGKQAAQDALAGLARAGTRLKSLTITAKDRMGCEPDRRCDPAVCDNAVGYYERLDGAVGDIHRFDAWTPERVRAVAAAHRLCPFDFSLDLARWADVVVCDYNYAFDPRVWLRFLLEEKREAVLFLVDEAHNLVDRGRDMFSAELRKARVLETLREVRRDAPELARPLRALNRRLLDLRGRPEVSGEAPVELLKAASALVQAGERWLATDESEPPWRALFRDLWFEAQHFVAAGERFDGDYRFIHEPSGRRDHRARIFCVDPAAGLRAGTERAARSVMFSATMSPADYYLELLGAPEGSGLLRLDSPFPRGHLRVFAAEHVPTVYRRRDESYEPIARLIERFRRFQAGNLLVFFPSYAYLEAVAERLEIPCERQVAGMDEAARAGFLEGFRSGGETLALAVMGGVFGEGIDLVGDRLAGAVVVGAGLPQIGPERDLIRKHFAARGRDGFHYAFTFPGWTRVLQAAGRVIRGPEDRGALLLIDERYANRTYRDLFPAHWPEVEYARRRL